MKLRSTPVGGSDSLLSAARLKSRILAILEAALERSELTQVQLADRLGVRKAAVNNVLRGNGNVTVSTLAEYLYALGYEADVTVVMEGEIIASMRERRAPRLEAITLRDLDRANGTVHRIPARQLNSARSTRTLTSRQWQVDARSKSAGVE
ncbi:helix-turn-helix domain-containing protein [Curtobacterium sp. NPDC090217]|uniref:helix-turn-helix domain-containing protein n=1 Tax=Curtobacterium sp. NPDC090217 TaxID=3363970 RepID=UPI0038027F37